MGIHRGVPPADPLRLPRSSLVPGPSAYHPFGLCRLVGWGIAPPISLAYECYKQER